MTASTFSSSASSSKHGASFSSTPQIRFIACRLCIKIILDQLIEAKHAGKLAPLPSKHDRFLRNILNITREFNDLVASFLHDFGLDESCAEVIDGCSQLPVKNGALPLSPMTKQLR